MPPGGKLALPFLGRDAEGGDLAPAELCQDPADHGDLATMDDEGFITVVDRKKDMIKTGGENVASREVEEALYKIAGVSEVAVIGLPHPKWIEAVIAVVVAKPGHTLVEDEVIAACSQSLAHFKVPKRVMLTDALPKNPSGKLLKRELRQKYEALFKA